MKKFWKQSWKMSLAVAGLAIMPALASQVSAGIQLQEIGRYESGLFDQSAAEITAYDPISQRLFVVNAQSNQIDILDMTDPALPVKVGVIDGAAYGSSINSVAVKNGLVAFASQANIKTDNGQVVFANTNGVVSNSVTVGALPDMLTFTPNGNKIIVANEAELPEDLGANPAGTISIIDVSGGAASATVNTADFTAFNAVLSATSGSDIKSSVRISPNAADAAADLEPEYISISADGSKAYVSLQENNALAVVDLNTNTVTHVLPLGVKDHSKADSGFISYDGVNNSSNALDTSDRDGIDIQTWNNVYGIYMPDAIATYEINGRIYVVTANEGDDRTDWEGYEDAERVKDLASNTAAFGGLLGDDDLGRLTVSTVDGVDGSGNQTELYVLGARSFSIWDVTDPTTWTYDATTGNMTGLVYDSGDDFERLTASLFPDAFNSTNSENDSLDNRSDNKGPEPEGVTTALIDGKWYVFISLERVGGIMVYEITDPSKPVFVQYINPRDFDTTLEEFEIGDLGPEGLQFISAVDSPTGKNLLVVANEVSGTTTIYQINSILDTPVVPEPATALLGLMGLGAMGLAAGRRGRKA